MTTTNPTNDTPAPAGTTTPVKRKTERWTYRPAVDIHETPDAVLLHADLPGVDPERVELELDGDLLTIQAHAPDRHADHTAVRQEFGVGDFHRRFSVAGDQIDPDAIDAVCRDGVLTVRLPKRSTVRKVPVGG